MTKKARGFIGGLAMLPPLDIEEERALYPIIEEGRRASAAMAKPEPSDTVTRGQLLRARQEGQEAESLLLRATFGLVRTRVLERGYHFYNEDLEAAGVEGLVNALKRFDPQQGNRFATYASYWITKLVNQSIQQQAGLSDAEMRLIVKLQRFERTQPTKRITKKEVAVELEVSQARAHEIMQLSRELQSRRYSSLNLDDVPSVSKSDDEPDAPSWVIDELRRLTGDNFDAFWQYTFKTMPMEEIADACGISRQAMAKRIEKSRRAVMESSEAERLQAWLLKQ